MLGDIFFGNERPCLLSAAGDKPMSYDAVGRAVVARANAIIEDGFAAGETAVLIGENSIDMALTLLAVWTAGGVAAPIDADLPDAQCANVLRSASPARIFASESAAKRRDWSNLAGGAPVALLPSAQDGVRRHVSAPFERARADEPFLIIYTAGSTAEPKGVMIAPGPLIANERLFCAAMGITAENRFFNILPMSYLGGAHNLLLLPMSVGASVVIDAPLGPTNLFSFWRRVRQGGVNTLWLTGAMLAMLLRIPPRDDESWISGQISLGLVGMAPLQASVRAAFEERFGFALHQNYALSETLFLTSQRPGSPAAATGCGALLPGIKLRVLDAAGADVAAGEPGELIAETPYMMTGYRNAAGADAAAHDGQTFRTGDLGRFDAAGELFIVGRQKDLIIRGGLNIAPSVVEAALVQTSEVIEAAVIGVPDPMYGEEVAAVVVLRDAAQPEEAIRALEEKLSEILPPFQRPKTILARRELPRNRANKIDKRAVRMLFSEAAQQL